MYPKIDMMNFEKYISILCQRQTSHLWAAEAKIMVIRDDDECFERRREGDTAVHEAERT